jgi:hypothetical protein
MDAATKAMSPTIVTPTGTAEVEFLRAAGAEGFASGVAALVIRTSRRNSIYAPTTSVTRVSRDRFAEREHNFGDQKAGLYVI